MEIHNHLPKRMMDIYEQWYVDNQKVKRWMAIRCIRMYI